MIHKTEAQEGFIKSSRQASSPAPQVPQFCLWGARTVAVSGQGVPARFGDAGRGSAPPARVQPYAVAGVWKHYFPAPVRVKRVTSIAVLATTGRRGSFLSLIDCTLVKICLKEILSFPCSFPLLPVLPFLANAPARPEPSTGGARAGRELSAQRCPCRCEPLGRPGRTLDSRLRFISVSRGLKTSSNSGR